MKLSRIFLACDDCGSTPGACDSPCQCDVTNHEKFATLEFVTRGNMYVIPPDSQQAALLGPGEDITRGFAFWDGAEDGGFIITAEPALTLPYINESKGNFSEDGTFQFILAATGETPHPWGFVGAPTTGTFLLSSVNGMFVFTATDEIPGLNTFFAGSTGALSIEVVGFYDSAQSDSAPVFVSRKIIGYDALTRPVVLIKNGTTLRWEQKALPEATALAHPLIGVRQIHEINTATLGQSNEDTGFEYRDNGDADNINKCPLLIYNWETKRLKLAPTQTNGFHQETSDVALVKDGNWHNASPHAEVSDVAVNYPNVWVSIKLLVDNNSGTGSASIRFNGLRLKMNGVVVHTWRDTTDEHDGDRDHAVEVLLTGVALGNKTFTLEYKESNSPVVSTATKFVHSTITVLSRF